MKQSYFVAAASSAGGIKGLCLLFDIVSQYGDEGRNENHKVDDEIAVGSGVDIVHQPKQRIEQIPQPGEGRLGLHHAEGVADSRRAGEKIHKGAVIVGRAADIEGYEASDHDLRKI